MSSEQSDSDNRAARDRRAMAVAELLRAGHSPAAVSRAVKIADAGGNIYEAMAALRREGGAPFHDRQNPTLHDIVYREALHDYDPDAEDPPDA